MDLIAHLGLMLRRTIWTHPHAPSWLTRPRGAGAGDVQEHARVPGVQLHVCQVRHHGARPTLQRLRQVHDLVRLWDVSRLDRDRLQLRCPATIQPRPEQILCLAVLWGSGSAGSTARSAVQHRGMVRPLQTSVSLELPRARTRSAEFVVVHTDGSAAPRKHALEVPSDGTVADIYAKLAQVPCQPGARCRRHPRCGACPPLRVKMHAEVVLMGSDEIPT